MQSQTVDGLTRAFPICKTVIDNDAFQSISKFDF